MPMYTYEFDDGTRLDMVQAMSSNTLKRIKHPDTGEWGQVKRVYSAPSISMGAMSGVRMDPTKSLEWNKAQID